MEKEAYANGKANGNGAVKSSVGSSRRKKTPIQADYVWMDGDLVPFERATVHFLTPTLHYGPGIFEGIRCYGTERGPAVFRGREHMQRFLHSAHTLGVMDISYNLDQLMAAVCMTVSANGFEECYIRPMMYFEGPLGLNLDAYNPVIGIAAWAWGAFLGEEKMETGARMMVSSVTRMHPNASMTKAKISGQYVNSILAKTMAVRAGFDEAVLLDPEGYVAECTGENLLVIRNNVIYTAPRATILEGVTRDTVLTLARDAGYQVVEERLSRDQLYIADEIFVCGTAAEVVPVREVDYRPVGSGKRGPITKQIQQLYHDAVRGKHPRSEAWLDYIVTDSCTVI
ncbi:MAG: branched-chain amino acid transaminase [Candidatus Promineifilaceae bacterium]